MKIFKATSVVALVTVILAATPAMAARTQIHDSEDVRGKLDLREVRRSGVEKVTWRLITHERWRVKDVWSVGYLVVDLDTRLNQDLDYYVVITPTHHGLKASLFRVRKEKKDYRMGKVKVWRKTMKSASIQLPLDRLRIGNNRTTYSWRAQTLFNGTESCRKVCFDMAPDQRAWVVEPLRVP